MHDTLKSILSQLIVVELIPKCVDSSGQSCDHIACVVSLKCKASASLLIPLVLKDRVFKASCSEGYNWSRADKEFMLYYTTRLELRRHQAEIAASVDESSIHEKLVRSGPEIIRIFLSKMIHLFRTFSSIRISWTSRATNYKLDLMIELMDDSFS